MAAWAGSDAHLAKDKNTNAHEPHGTPARTPLAISFPFAEGVDRPPCVVRVRSSELIRAMLIALGGAVELHAPEARSLGRLRRSRNDAWLSHKRGELEFTIAKAFTAATRASSGVDQGPEGRTTSSAEGPHLSVTDL